MNPWTDVLDRIQAHDADGTAVLLGRLDGAGRRAVCEAGAVRRAAGPATAGAVAA